MSCVGIRRQVIDQIRRLCLSIRLGVPRVYHRKSGVFYGRNCKNIWTLKLTGAENWKFRKIFNMELPAYVSKSAKFRIEHGICPTTRKFWRRGKDFYWMRVTKTEIIDSPEYVYDLVLEKEPHSFTTPAGVIHNCSEFGYICRHDPLKAE